jgi:hypothetical protein
MEVNANNHCVEEDEAGGSRVQDQPGLHSGQALTSVFLITWEAEIGGSQFKVSQGKNVRETISKTSQGMVAYTYNPNYTALLGRRTTA